ncbi:MAG: hypothetical protein ACRDAU_00605 [Clostridium sp.]
MLEKYKGYLTKKNTMLIGVIIICMMLILYVALNIIFPSEQLNTSEKAAARNTIRGFITEMSKKDKKDIKKYMVDGWEEKGARNVFLGAKELENLEIIEIKNDGYSQYCEKYVKNRNKKGIELTGDKYSSFTVDLLHKYKKGSKYKDETKKIVFLLEKNKGDWKIITLGTSGMIDYLI